MLRIILILSIFIVRLVQCNLQQEMQSRIHDYKEKSERLYGRNANIDLQPWEMELGNPFLYPRGNKQKLAYNSQQWLRYYECTADLLASLTEHGRLPSTYVAAYEGAVTKLTCGICVAPNEGGVLVWMYAKSMSNLTFTPLNPKPTVVREPDGNLTMYHVEAEDAGVYRCEIGKTRGGLVVLEVTDEPYRMVKPMKSFGPYPEPPTQITQELTVYSIWSPWSECNRCDSVGRRRRYGMCFVTLLKGQKFNLLQNKTNTTNVKVSQRDLEVFKDFPKGIPYSSNNLPITIRNMKPLKNRTHEIMLGLCRVPCRDKIFEVRLQSGELVEQVNNSAGEYSLLQALPPTPANPPATLIFVEKGKPLLLKCQGTALIDMPYTWQVGTRPVIPRKIYEESGGRLQVNARDQLVFTRVEYRDTNVYSCWQGTSLCSYIKLKVSYVAKQHCARYLVATAAVAAAAFTLTLLYNF